MNIKSSKTLVSEALNEIKTITKQVKTSLKLFLFNSDIRIYILIYELNYTI